MSRKAASEIMLGGGFSLNIGVSTRGISRGAASGGGALTASDGLYIATNSSIPTTTLSSRASLVDGDKNTASVGFWGYNETIGLDMGSATLVRRIRVYCNLSSAALLQTGWTTTASANSVAAYRSADNVSWTLIETQNQPGQSTVQMELGRMIFDFTFTADQTYRYFSLTPVGGSTPHTAPNSYTIYPCELEAYATTGT